MSWQLMVGIALAGVLGTLCRWGIALLPWWGTSFPWATLAVNLLGSFCAGVFWAWAQGRLSQLLPWLPVVSVGFLGAFTTFSTCMLDSANLLLAGRPIRFLLYALLQGGGGISCVIGGILLGRWLAS